MARGWQQEFAETRTKVTSDFALRVLEDNTISDVEWRETMERANSCLIRNGYPSKIEGDQLGGSSIPANQYDGEKVNLAFETCNRETGYIEIQVLRDRVRRNPTNRDNYEIQAECIVGSGLVDPSFSGQQLKEAESKFHESQPKSDLVMSDPSPRPGQIVTVTGAQEAVGSVADFIAFTDPKMGEAIYRKCEKDPLGLLTED